MIFRNKSGLRVSAIMTVVVVVLCCGCFTKRGRDRSQSYAQALEEQKNKTDNLRNAMRYLKQMTPLNRKQAAKEVQLELNTWLTNADRTRAQYSSSQLLGSLPEDLLGVVGCKNPVELSFHYWDVDYLYERRLANQLAKWITNFPVRDNLMEPILDKYASRLAEPQRIKLYEAYKLFDWTVRNIAMEVGGASVEQTTLDPRGPIDDAGFGYGYLPWENMLFSTGDFIERGRVFGALADQRGIDTVWISVGAAAGEPGKLWAIGVIIADEILLFEPKLGLPILDSDKMELATLRQARENDRVLRRLDLAGQFDYALTASDLKQIQFLIDATPASASARMKMLEQSLLSDERMTLYEDVDALRDRLKAIEPDVPCSLWLVPLLAQVQAASVRERLENPSPYSMQYMAQNGVWLLENSVALGRRKHLVGEFESTLDTQGALALYMEGRVDDEAIAKLAYDPEVQHGLGITRYGGEEKEQFAARIAQAQYILGMSKFDAHYLLAQLHFDRGNYKASEDFWLKRVLEDGRAQKWWSTGHYTLGRIYQERGEIEQAAKELAFAGSPQEAGNRLRLRYLRREPDK